MKQIYLVHVLQSPKRAFADPNKAMEYAQSELGIWMPSWNEERIMLVAKRILEWLASDHSEEFLPLGAVYGPYANRVSITPIEFVD